MSSDSFLGEKEKNQRKRVEQLIDSIEYYPYYINIGFKSTSEESVSKKKLHQFLEEIRLQSEGLSNEQLLQNRHRFKYYSWEIEISLTRKTDPNRKRSLGFITHGARSINTSKPLLTALLDKKASKYGLIDSPYAICLNTNDSFIEEDAFAESLFGQPSTDKINLNYTYKYGLFYAKTKALNTRISAVIFFKSFDTFTLDNSSISIWHNPFAKNPIPIGLIPFDEYIFEQNGNTLHQTKYLKNVDIFNTLQIDKDNYVSWKDKSVG